MGRLARHRKIKNVSSKGKKPDPAKNAPPSKKDEAEFRKIMQEWNKPPEPRKKKQQPQQVQEVQDESSTSTSTPTSTSSTSSSSTSTPSSTTKRKREQEKAKQQPKKKATISKEDEWIELDLDDDPASGPVSLNDLIEKQKKQGAGLDTLLSSLGDEDDEEGDGVKGKKKKKKKSRRTIGRIENIDVKHDELESLKQLKVNFPEMEKGENYAAYMKRLRAATGKKLRDHAMKVDKKPLRESRKQHLKKREEKKKNKKSGDSSSEQTDASVLNALTTAREQGPSSQPLFITERKEEKVRFFDQVEEPPKLQAPLNAKKQLQLAKRREEEKMKKKEEESKTAPAEAEKKTVAQRSMELLRARAVANYKMSKLREKQKRTLALAGVPTNKGKKKEEPAATYL